MVRGDIGNVSARSPYPSPHLVRLPLKCDGNDVCRTGGEDQSQVRFTNCDIPNASNNKDLRRYFQGRASRTVL